MIVHAHVHVRHVYKHMCSSCLHGTHVEHQFSTPLNLYMYMYIAVSTCSLIPDPLLLRVHVHVYTLHGFTIQPLTSCTFAQEHCELVQRSCNDNIAQEGRALGRGCTVAAAIAEERDGLTNSALDDTFTLL